MSDDSNMWADHLGHLKRIALSRYQQPGGEPRGFIIWRICELDTYACLLGHGTCEFIRHVLQNNMLPPLEQQIPAASPAAPYMSNEAAVFPAILNLRRNVMIYTAKMAQLAQTLRAEAASRRAISPGAYARWQAATAQAQSELSTAWAQAYPDFLAPESPEAGHSLPHRVRYVFEQVSSRQVTRRSRNVTPRWSDANVTQAYLLYQAATIYSRTSMFPTQRHAAHPAADSSHTDVERRVMCILAVASSTLEAGNLAARHVVFPLFMAGFATLQADAKVKVLELIAAFETSGIGTNTARTRRLLKAVYEEQRMAYDAGGSMGDVDWLAVARERKLTVVNCGL